MPPVRVRTSDCARASQRRTHPVSTISAITTITALVSLFILPRAVRAFVPRHPRVLAQPLLGRAASASHHRQLRIMASTGGGDRSTLLAHLDYLRGSTRLVLASKSPRRVEIFGLLGFAPGPGSCFEVIPSTFAEDLDHAGFESAAQYAATNAEAKGREVASQLIQGGGQGGKTVIVVGSDTVVDLDGKILEKPGDAEEAFAMVKSLAGRRHLVHSGVAIFSSKGPASGQDIQPVVKFAESTEVTFAPLTDDEIRQYVKSGEPMDKAGAYGIQGLGGQMVTGVNGCYFNVMGFPMHRFANHLAALIEKGLA